MRGALRELPCILRFKEKSLAFAVGAAGQSSLRQPVRAPIERRGSVEEIPILGGLHPGGPRPSGKSRLDLLRAASGYRDQHNGGITHETTSNGDRVDGYDRYRNRSRSGTGIGRRVVQGAHDRDREGPRGLQAWRASARPVDSLTFGNGRGYGKTVRFTGVNVQIVSGSGATETIRSIACTRIESPSSDRASTGRNVVETSTWSADPCQTGAFWKSAKRSARSFWSGKSEAFFGVSRGPRLSLRKRWSGLPQAAQIPPD